MLLDVAKYMTWTIVQETQKESGVWIRGLLSVKCVVRCIYYIFSFISRKLHPRLVETAS